MMNNSNYNLSVQSPNNKMLPNSFKTALEEIEEEILELKADVSFATKEYKILKSEQDTIVDVANTQDTDIKRYLQKEIKVLEDVIQRTDARQRDEFKRLHKQVADVKAIILDLDASRMVCVKKHLRVETVLGIKTDPNEAFLRPLEPAV